MLSSDIDVIGTRSIRQLTHRWLALGSSSRFLALLVGGTAVGQALVFLTTPIISRLYSQTEIGQFGLFLAFLSVAGVAVTARYELAIPSAENDGHATTLLLLSLALIVPVSFVCAAALFVLVRWKLLAFGALPLWTVLAIVPALMAFGAFSALRLWFVRAHRFGEIGRVLIVQGAGRATVPVVLGVMHLGAVGLISGEIVGRLIGVSGMIRGASIPLRIRDQDWLSLRLVAKKYWKHPGILLPSGLLDMLATALPVPLISQYYGVAAAGSFLLIQRLSMVPASLIGTSVGDVFHVRMADAMSADLVIAKQTLNRAAVRLLRIGALVLIPAVLVAPIVLPPLLGPDWSNSGFLFAAIAPWSLGSLVVTPLSRVLAITERKELKLIYDLSALTLLVGIIIASSRAGLGFIQTIALASAGQVIAYAVYFALLRKACESPVLVPILEN